jgi:hypothetical protein
MSLLFSPLFCLALNSVNLFTSIFLLVVKFCQKEKKKFKKKIKTSNFINLHCVAENIKGWLKICTLFLFYNLIWLNLPKDNGHFFYIFLWMMATLATNKKFLKRRWFTWAFPFSPSQSYLRKNTFEHLQ